MASDRDENAPSAGDGGPTASGAAEDLSVAERRAGAQKLSQVLSAADDAALERFRKRRLDEGDIPLERLRRLRSLLVMLVRMVDSGAPDAWERLDDAVDLLLGADESPADEVPVDEPSDALAERRQPAPQEASEVEGVVSESPLPPERLDRPAKDPPPREIASVVPPPAAHTNLPAREAPGFAAPPPAASPWAAARANATAPSVHPPPTSDGASTPRPASEQMPPHAVEPHAVDEAHAIDEEGTVVDMVIPTRPALPFQDSKFPPPSAEPSPPATSREVPSFDYGSLAHPLAMRVEEYARLCVARDRGTEPLTEVERQLEIHDVPTREAVDRMFQRLFAADPQVYASWEQHYRRIVGTANG